MGSRRKGRVLAFQTIFSWEMTDAPLDDLLVFFWLDEEKKSAIDEETLAFARYIVSGTIENIDAVDGAIKKQLEHWDFSRVAKVDLAVLRISVYALLYQNDIPASVTIDEAIDIAKDFSSEESYRFINGILDGIRKKRVHNEQIH
jgi:transcription antitermination protein NusB